MLLDNMFVRGTQTSKVDQTMSKNATLEPRESSIRWLQEFEIQKTCAAIEQEARLYTTQMITAHAPGHFEFKCTRC